ncbi:MAG: proline--tRNA ligase [Elusimicrobia bacterium]|nr:proline--tRNA ligase [Elusimicrobiota bacterium]
MKLSSYFLPTLRQAPGDADNISTKLMFRAALIRKLASGIYEWLPLGFKVLKKVENIVREELDKIGAQEVWLPVIQPKDLWVETGRWAVYGKELLRIKDRKDSEFCFAPTAEEVITNMVRRDVTSHRQLPMTLYQFGAKFRDEIRPRFGVMRAREFYMKDAYSFHATEEDCENYYKVMFKAYERIFKRCGFKFMSVEADSGPIGGNLSHEFMVISETGEAQIALCDCGYAANVEKAEAAESEYSIDESKFKPMADIATPDMYTVEDVANFMKISKKRFIKTLFFIADEEPVLALIRGDNELNENKLRKALNAVNLEKASETVYQSISDCKVGFAGPVDIKSRFKSSKDSSKPLKTIIADYALKGVLNGVSGANKDDYHTVNINIGRDYNPDAFADLHVASEGDLCLKCGNPLKFSRGIEVGQTFKLGVKYSKSLKCEFVDEHQKSIPMVMGCYGIGISRIVAAAIEQSNDKDGIIWPPSIAPFEISLITIETEDEEVYKTSERIYNEIHKIGMTVLWDERNERAGIKFKDSDLIGLPYRIVISAKTLKDSECEFKMRSSDKAERWKLSELSAKLLELKNKI